MRPIESEAADLVDTATAQIISSQEPPLLVKKRMQHTVAVIAEQLMTGKTLNTVEAERLNYEKIIHEVFDKVLVGYSVNSVEIIPGENVQVNVKLLPWAQVINNIEVKIEVEGMKPEVEEQVRQDLGEIENVFKNGLDGLPVAAADWTNGVLKRSLNEYMGQHLPEFRADFDIVPDSSAAVKVIIYPKLPIVRTVDLNMRSDTIPNFSLLSHRDLMEKQISMLVGVPVGFVARHSDYFAALFAKELDSQSDFRALGMKTKVSFKAAENILVMSRSDTKRYNIRLIGWADINHRKVASDRRTMLRLHIGQNLTSTDEIFIRGDLYPQDPAFEWAIGYNRMLTSSTQLHTAYDMTHSRFILGGRQRLAPRWFLRYEYRWSDHLGEVGLCYQMHDFLGLEFVHDKKDNWMRVIGVF